MRRDCGDGGRKAVKVTGLVRRMIMRSRMRMMKELVGIESFVAQHPHSCLALPKP